MKAGKFKTLWVILKSIYITTVVCSHCIICSVLGRLNRQWVDIHSRRWSTRLLNAAHIKYTVYNPHQISCDQNVPYILMCNHSSLYDIPLAFVSMPGSIRMLAKKELSRIPIFGKALLKAEFPFIERHNRTQAAKDLEHAKNIMESGIRIWIFPEGTRSKTGKLLKFKKGGFLTAIQAKAHIIPVGIRGADKILPAQSLNFNFDQHAEIHIGTPIDASLYTLARKEALVAAVESQIKTLSGQ